MHQYVFGDHTLDYILGPIIEYLNDPHTTDIVINRPFQVLVRRDGVWEQIEVASFDEDTLDAATILIGHRNGREFDEGHPYLNATMPGGQRFQAVRRPGTTIGHFLWAIRRPPTKARTMFDDDIADLLADVNKPNIQRIGSAKSLAGAYRAENWWEVLVGARRAGLSIGICGSTGDGKSDVGRRLVQVYRQHIRMVTIETDDEVGEAGPMNKAPLIYDDTQVSSDDALKIAKRLVPDEILLQEVRGAEAYTLLLALNSGHNGLTTWHANEGEEIAALAEMARYHPAAAALSDERLSGKCRNAFDVIAYAKRTDRKRHDDDKGFRITSIRLLAAELEASA